MSIEKSNKLPAATTDSTYDVGYAKPPVETRFKKGQSGNPRGRPKGAKNELPALHEERLKDIVLQEAYRTITVQDAGRSVTIPMAQAVIRAMTVNAAKGQHRAQRLFSELLASTETSRRRLHDEYFEGALTYKTEWDKELERRKQASITNLPDPLPHPNQIVLDMRTGTVRMTGPMTKEEKVLFDDWAARKPEIREAVANLRENLEDEPNPAERADIQKHIEIGEKLLGEITQAIPD